MRAWKWLVGLAAAGAALVALREWAMQGGTGAPALAAGAEEPVLGYDGMDRDTLLDWLGDADLDRDTLLRIRDYEEANRGREPVLEALATMLD